MFRVALFHLAVLLPPTALLACDDSFEESSDASVRDSGARDATISTDAGSRDATAPGDLGLIDSGRDAGSDAGVADDATIAPDAEISPDASTTDGGPVGRSQHEATLLLDGRVLITGGFAGVALDTAAIYDSSSGTFTAIADRMSVARRLHRAVRLQDGRVLVTGGRADDANPHATAEVFDPSTGLFTPTVDMLSPRELHSVALLPSGEVLLAAGFNQTDGALDTVEIYAASLDSSRSIPGFLFDAGGRAIVELLDGRFLIAGGHRGAEVRAADIFDPSDESITPTGDMVRGVLRAAHTRLSDGRVFFAGGSTVNTLNDLGQIYDPMTGSFSTTTGTMAEAAAERTANLLPDGRVLVAGGYTAANTRMGAEIFDPSNGRFDAAGPGFLPRAGHTATTLADGRVLIVGGYLVGPTTDNAQLYDPTTNSFSNTGPLPPN